MSFKSAIDMLTILEYHVFNLRLSQRWIATSKTTRCSEMSGWTWKQLFRMVIIYHESGWIDKDEMSDSYWMMFCAFGMAFTIQIGPRYCVETKRIYDWALFVDNEKYEWWIHCLAEFVQWNAITDCRLVEDSLQSHCKCHHKSCTHSQQQDHEYLGCTSWITSMPTKTWEVRQQHILHEGEIKNKTYL